MNMSSRWNVKTQVQSSAIGGIGCNPCRSCCPGRICSMLPYSASKVEREKAKMPSSRNKKTCRRRLSDWTLNWWPVWAQNRREKWFIRCWKQTFFVSPTSEMILFLDQGEVRSDVRSLKSFLNEHVNYSSPNIPIFVSHACLVRPCNHSDRTCSRCHFPTTSWREKEKAKTRHRRSQMTCPRRLSDKTPSFELLTHRI